MNSMNLFSLSSEFWNFIGQLEIVLNFVVLLIGVLIAFFKRKQFINWILKGDTRPETLSSSIAPDFIEKLNTCQGLVLILSRYEQMWWLVDKVSPEYVTIIASRTEEFKNNAQKFQSELDKKNLKTQLFFIDDINSIEESYSVTKQAIDGLKKFDVANLILDVTGGTKPMGIGAYKAGKELEIKVSYVSVPFWQAGKANHSGSKIMSI